jgi:hypothetical protein
MTALIVVAALAILGGMIDAALIEYRKERRLRHSSTLSSSGSHFRDDLKGSEDESIS